MTSIHQLSRATTSSARRRSFRAAAVGGAGLATSLLWLIARTLGADLRADQHNGQGPQVIGVPLILGFTLVISSLGWCALALLEHYTRRATIIWSALAISILLLSFAPILLAGASTGTKTTLALIHLTVAAILIPALQRDSPKGS
ncbi:DUF6069 family protein [Actinoallomurus purpureus]|uniref:DUF6069 family protein n=1 Tax=Actinoallomurus purpureus TaxID=478114 RepID=UPI002093A429|nr:DUF6069 family protein [Actinoallomurus purpureus]MCO6004130.1 DUF6069 family protein [Actinoallomurus purpureus]